MRKPTRTLSGVSPITVVVEPRKCPHGTCVYCPTLGVPQSYTPESPAVMRAAALNYDPYKQVSARLRAFAAMGHPTDKVELIIIGGTVFAYPLDYLYDFVRGCFSALNGTENRFDLETEKKINERAKHRCVNASAETRPDFCGEKEINIALDLGLTRCELGVQAIDDEILALSKRRHTVSDVERATRLLKDSGFHICYHLMLGLPGSNFEHDVKMFERIFNDERFMPDQIKIYPTQVIKGSELEEMYMKGHYKPYDEEELIELLIKLKMQVPNWCRIMRVMREISPTYLVAGTRHIHLREIVRKEMKRRGLKCKCIRCNEIGFVDKEKAGGEIKLKKVKYHASGGEEIFLHFVNANDVIFAICRLRIPGAPFRKEIDDKTLLVRELHTYGREVEIGTYIESEWQHKGFGAALMREAENIAREEGCNKIVVLSGVGTREYYKKFGYTLVGSYMCKQITN